LTLPQRTNSPWGIVVVIEGAKEKLHQSGLHRENANDAFFSIRHANLNRALYFSFGDCVWFWPCPNASIAVWFSLILKWRCLVLNIEMQWTAVTATAQQQQHYQLEERRGGGVGGRRGTRMRRRSTSGSVRHCSTGQCETEKHPEGSGNFLKLKSGINSTKSEVKL
jgi:hypothetical protein